MKYGVAFVPLTSHHCASWSIHVMYGMTVSERMYCSSPEANRAELTAPPKKVATLPVKIESLIAANAMPDGVLDKRVAPDTFKDDCTAVFLTCILP